jgi:hypothetical protein
MENRLAVGWLAGVTELEATLPGRGPFYFAWGCFRDFWLPAQEAP